MHVGMAVSEGSFGSGVVLIVDFLEAVGLQVRAGELAHDTVLPGIECDAGVLVYDPSQLAEPGDLLHEAGHLALALPGERAMAGADLGPAFELGAIAWSVAACKHLGLDLATVFHDQGYLGDAAWLRAHYGGGGQIGVPLLVWRGLTTEDRFPEMHAWLAENLAEDPTGARPA